MNSSELLPRLQSSAKECMPQEKIRKKNLFKLFFRTCFVLCFRIHLHFIFNIFGDKGKAVFIMLKPFCSPRYHGGCEHLHCR